jgi:hypothetical protein
MVFKNAQIEKSWYDICGNTFCMKLNFFGMFTMLRCIPNCPYLCNCKIYANARHGVMKCSFILFNIKTKVIGELFCFKGYLSPCQHVQTPLFGGKSTRHSFWVLVSLSNKFSRFQDVNLKLKDCLASPMSW